MKSDLNFLHAVFAHEIADFVGMMAFDDNLMIANGMAQKIRFQVGVKQDLRTAKMLVVINWQGLCFGNKKTVQLIAANDVHFLRQVQKPTMYNNQT